MSHPVRLKAYGSPRTPAPTIAIKTFAKVLGCEDRGLALPRRGVSSLDTGDRRQLDEQPASRSNPISSDEDRRRLEEIDQKQPGMILWTEEIELEEEEEEFEINLNWEIEIAIERDGFSFWVLEILSSAREGMGRTGIELNRDEGFDGKR